MNGYEFISSIFSSVTSLAWPAAIVACVWMFRERLNNLLPRMMLKHGETEISFRIEEAQAEAEHLPQAPALEDQAPTPPVDDRFQRLAEVSPAGAILEAWSAVDLRMKEKLVEAGSSPSNFKGPIQIINALVRYNKINLETLTLINQLREIRNTAVHSVNEPTREDALSYKRLADIVLADLEKDPRQFYETSAERQNPAND